MPIIEVLRRYPKRVLLVAGAYISSGIFLYLVAVYNLVYATEVAEISRDTMLLVVMGTSVIGLACVPIMGAAVR